METSNQPKFIFGEIDQKDDKKYSTVRYSMLEKYDDTSSLNSKHKKNVLRGSIANVFDLINSSSFKNSRVATHHHSIFATTKLASMVIARIEGDSPQLIQQRKVEHEHIPHVFRRYILVNKEVVSRSNAQRLVVKFTFQVINPNEQLPEFLPGDCIEILSHIKGQVLLRSYTPLQSNKDKCFSIIIKIYEEGLMSKHLVNMLYLY